MIKRILQYVRLWPQEPTLASVIGPLKRMKAELQALQDANVVKVKLKSQQIDEIKAEVAAHEEETAQANAVFKNLLAITNVDQNFTLPATEKDQKIEGQ